MTIEDPTALPETADAAQEYLREADAAFEREDNDSAEPLYYSVLQSSMLGGPDESRINHRLALIHMARGENDEAYRFAHASREPGRDDILKALDGATTDPPVDPTVIPQTFEELERWWNAAIAAKNSADVATEEALLRAVASCPAASPGDIAHAAARVAEITHADGRNDEARAWAESALANASGDDDRKVAEKILQAVGGPAPDSNPYETDGSRQLMAGLAAWEAGDQPTAKTAFEAVLVATDVTGGDKGKAAFYLGSMAYHAKDYDTARTHLHTARDQADDPEKAWASEMLEWRWQEEGS